MPIHTCTLPSREGTLAQGSAKRRLMLLQSGTNVLTFSAARRWVLVPSSYSSTAPRPRPLAPHRVSQQLVRADLIINVFVAASHRLLSGQGCEAELFAHHLWRWGGMAGRAGVDARPWAHTER